MALTDIQLAQLRLMISEADATGGWTDETLQELADLHIVEGVYDIRATAAQIWEMKAANFVELTTVSESGSSRSLGEVFTHAKQMADYFKKPLTDPTPADTAVYPISTKIVRPVRGA
jgi:hypothetical protein